jgi:diaminopimelate epimerase
MPESSSIPLIKAHALGNDFLLVETASLGAIPEFAEFARRVCDRHRGIGADGLMVLKPTAGGAETRLFNADGGEAEVSGNGVRCAAAWLAQQRSLRAGASLVLETAAGPKRLELLAGQGAQFRFRADMGPPAGVRQTEFDVAGQRVAAVVLQVGNPQCVVLGPATEARLATIGAALAVHPAFPAGTNVELASVETPDRVRILIWERGVGPTQASGTGACAAAVAAAFAGGASRAVDVISPGGSQHVEWTSNTIFLTGQADVVARIDWWT